MTGNEAKDKSTCQIGRHESILGLWLNHPFDIRAQIALPTGRLKHVYYIVFIDIYSKVW
jgi:hypothetical protein